MRLKVLNLEQARFDCTFGRGCDGICCRVGRPPVYEEDAQRINDCLQVLLPLLRPEARTAIEKAGFLTRRRKAGQPTARVVNGWCVFFNRGCTLHRLGETEGAPFRYKPGLCAVFPLEKNRHGHWFVRQKGYGGEIWELPCLDPATSPVPATQSLQPEIALVEEWESRRSS